MAAVGFLKAVERFDFAYRSSFRTYAVAMVCGELARYRRDLGSLVRMPRDRGQLAVILARRIPEMTGQLRRSPTVGELAGVVGTNEEAVIEALEMARSGRALSLTAFENDDGELRCLPALVDADTTPEQVERRQLLALGMQALGEVERTIVELRFYREWTQEQIAREVGISQMHVSRLLRRAMATLEQKLAPVFRP